MRFPSHLKTSRETTRPEEFSRFHARKRSPSSSGAVSGIEGTTVSRGNRYEVPNECVSLAVTRSGSLRDFEAVQSPWRINGQTGIYINKAHVEKHSVTLNLFSPLFELSSVCSHCLPAVEDWVTGRLADESIACSYRMSDSRDFRGKIQWHPC